MLKIPNEVIFSILRIIKQGNPGDTYYEAYRSHLEKRGESFFDLYHFCWSWGIEHKPKHILEIGTRTGISLCQLLSGYIDYSNIQRVVSCDVFNDGFISPELVKYNLKLCGIPRETIEKIEFKVGDSKVTVPQLEGTFSYILVDGDHSREGARVDLENASKRVAKDGVIVFDDIAPDGCSLIDVWEAFKDAHKDEYEFNQDLNGKGLGWCIRR
jgi:predicted O-methyltransferase YrrM